jgi:cytochrome c oxidase subunit 2
MKKLLLLSAAMFLAGCTPGAPTVDSAASSSSSMTSSASSMAAMERSSMPMPVVSSSSSSAAAVSSAPAEAKVRTIEITATDWAFAPATITVKKGEKVRLVVKSTQGIHSFAIPSLRINERLDVGTAMTIDLPTDAAGTFDFRCAIPCGPGHKDMKGQIVIQ